MTKAEARQRIEEAGIIPAVRLSSAEDALFAAEAVASGGIPIVEVTMTVPGALRVIQELTRQNPHMIVGAGTVLELETAHRCIDGGAAFITSPGLDINIVECALKRDVLAFPGALTPTEVIAAWKAGSDFVKIFPCVQVGGPAYIKALKGPLPQVPVIAAGGVTQQTIADFILAGAAAVGIGANLIAPDAIHSREPDWIRHLAQRFTKLVKGARQATRSE
ncbi:MAG: bifunctional 4-hydroxy-2-oxoglutarate aldolase/2-dehydro-3-deoxy-phosphogluconate aldolase [Bryobacterales bacterium]|nr:bifunctional 4-hydroxy-2-oxoglutarate aldolase/2-dehydro-3-deoxy-phosphogluconate aldolase [Bryobacterales bacterium]MBV9398913.1 bifunctional 4-hydroxy-2-oxoglutarate aldolase/2-dehydro-3-deoxy-phosphogluconate aldolase [Bryobacterales bacterium]